MTRFVVLYYAPKEAIEAIKDIPPEEAAEGMKAWADWAERCGPALIDMGTPLGNGMMVKQTGNAPSEKDIAGYSFLEAENIDAAMALLEGHPALGWGDNSAVEVHEAMPLPGM
jgi:hypothetical protein